MTVKNKPKTPKQLERYFKGAANHRRLEILFLLVRIPGLTLEQISDNLRCNMKTISGHTRRLVRAGLIRKRYRGAFVEHTLSPYGTKFYRFTQSFSYSREYEND